MPRWNSSPPAFGEQHVRGQGARPADRSVLGRPLGTADLSDAAPWPGFPVAADAAVRHLRARFGLDLWLVSHVGDGEQTVVTSAGPWTELARPGARFRWTETLCRRLLTTGAGIAVPDVHAGDPTIAAGPLSRVRSYVGVPLVTADGDLFGTLCAYHGRAFSSPMDDVLDGAVLLGRMLSTIRASEQAALDRSAEAAEAYAAAARDHLTGLLNRRGWQAALEVEEQRLRRYGGQASVLVLDLDGLKHINDTAGHVAGNEALTACARVLSSTCRPGDAAARTGGDEFAVLAVQCDAVCVRAIGARLRTRLRTAGVAASLGTATRRVGEDLEQAFARADMAMYRDKRRRSAGSPSLPRQAAADEERRLRQR